MTPMQEIIRYYEAIARGDPTPPSMSREALALLAGEKPKPPPPRRPRIRK